MGDTGCSSESDSSRGEGCPCDTTAGAATCLCTPCVPWQAGTWVMQVPLSVTWLRQRRISVCPAPSPGHREHAAPSAPSSGSALVRTATRPCTQAGGALHSSSEWELPRHPSTDRPCAGLPCPLVPAAPCRASLREMQTYNNGRVLVPQPQHPHLKL